MGWKQKYTMLKGRLSPNAIKIIANTSWLSSETVLRMVVSLFVTIWLARYLGPSLFGTYNYAIAFVGLFHALLSMGLQGIVVHELVEQPHKWYEVLGTSFVIKLMGAYASLLFIVLAMQFMADDQAARPLIFIIAAGTLFTPFTNTVELWFQSQVRSKFSALAKTFAFFVVSVVRVVLILMQAPLIAFAWVLVFEAVTATCVLLFVYIKDGNHWRYWSVSSSRIKSMLSKSWPLILSAVGVSIYFKIDQIMLGELTNDAEVGIYAAAVRFSEIWYFLPQFMAASVFPSLIAKRQKDTEGFEIQLQRLYTLVVWLGIGVSFFVTLIAYPLITILYGVEYAGAVPILAIHVWSASFIFAGAILSKWLIMESLFGFSLVRHMWGAVVNVALNIFLIPYWGGTGAAVATVISYMVASYLACFTYRPTFFAGKMITLGYLAPLMSVARLVKGQKDD